MTKSRLNKPKRPSSKQSGDSVVACLSTSRARRAAEQALLAEESQSENTEVVDLQTLKDTIDQLPQVNASRVVDLHNRIKAKEYEIDVAGLAEKLMAFEERLDR